MNVFVVIALCFLPLVILCAVCVIFAGVKLGRLLVGALLGLMAVLPILFFQFFVGDLRVFNERSFASELVRAIVLSGLVEELWKAVVLFVLPARKMMLRDFFACAVVAGLSLGCFENAVYFLRYMQMAHVTGAQLLYVQIFTRMATASLIHLSCTGLGGLFVWAAKRRKQEIIALFFAVTSHGLYNFFAMYTTGIKFFSAVPILFALVECRVRYLKMHEAEAASEIGNM